MKKILFLSLLLFSGTLAISQDTDEPRYLFGNNQHYSFSGFGGPFVQFGQCEDEFAVYTGGGGAFLINQTFYFGGYGTGLSTNHSRLDVMIDHQYYHDLRTSFGHGGFWLGYIHEHSELIHAGFSTKLGWGELSLYNENYDFDHYDYIARDNVFVITPQLEIEMNMTKWFKMNLGLGYVGVMGVNTITYTDNNTPIFEASDYNTFTGTVTLMFGYFK